jgi:hypothetical protein
MTPFDNGFGDWNLDWQQWQKGSALGVGGGTAPPPATSGQGQTDVNTTPVNAPARLRPQTL